jgi:DNA-binding LacI/PurR family transcriptional regulator
MATSRTSPKSTGNRPTIVDVARVAGVSKSLVSLVLKGDSSVSNARRIAVLKAIEELNYKPSLFARQLASGATRSIGVLVTDYKNLSYINVLKGLREIFDDAGYQVIVSDLHRSSNFAEDPVDAFTSMHVDALVFIAEPAGLRTAGLTVPTIMIGERENLVAGSDVVFSDDDAGTRLVLDHLRGLGHRSIAHLTGVGGIATNRRKAFIKQMQEHGLAPEVFGISQPTTEIGGYMGAKELIQSGKKFTAVYAANDYMAAGAISAFAEARLRVPEDISIVGYDNAPISAEYMLKMTTVDDMGIAIGRNAAMRILERLGATAGSTATKPKKILLQPDLVVRSSTIPLKRK